MSVHVTISDEQYELVNFLQHGKYGENFKRIAEQRIIQLERLKQKLAPHETLPKRGPNLLPFKPDPEPTVGNYFNNR